MLSLGIDIGTSTVKLVLLKNQEIEKQWMAVHHGNPFVCLKKGLSTLELAMDTPFSLCVTGSNTEALLEQDSAIPSLGDIPAIVEGVRWRVRSLKLAVRAHDSSRTCRAAHLSFQSTNTARAVQVRSLKNRCLAWAAGWEITLRW